MGIVYGYLDGEGYVVEEGGSLRTGPFKSWEDAVRWYRRELDLDLQERRPS